MPIYEFICRDCGKEFDELVPSDWKAAGIACPVCSSHELERAVSRLGAISSGGKLQVMGEGPSCSHCSTGGCSTCH